MNTEFICTPGASTYEVQASGYGNGANFWYESYPGIRNDTGVRVNAYTALGNCHVWKALNVLAGDVGQLPVKLFKKVNGKSVEVEGVPEIDCLRREPNPWTLPSVWKETAMWVAALRGNSLNWIFRPSPQSIRLVPLRQDRVSVEIDDELTGDFYYTYKTEKGATIPFDREEILHIQGLASNGIWGLDLLDVARNSIGQGLAIEKHVNKSFSSGARPMGILKHKGRPSKEARQAIRQEWDEMHAGAENAGRIAVIAEEMDYVATSMTMEHAQVEELRRLDREFVASIFNLPLFKLNSMEHSSTRSNLEQQNQEYLQGSLMRWLNRFAEEFARKILSERQRKEGYYYRWVTEALLRGDTQSRFSAYGVAIQNRIMNPNEVREKEDMPAYEGGDEYGNPNIDPKQSPEDAKAANDASNAGGRPPGSQSADRLIIDRLRHLIRTECNDVRRGAEVKGFIAWADEYYGVDGGFWRLTNKTLTPTAEAVRDILAGYRFDWGAWSVRHAEESKRRILSVCERATEESLNAAIAHETEAWILRAVLDVQSSGNIVAPTFTVLAPKINVAASPASVTVSPTPVVVNVPKQPAPQVIVDVPESKPPDVIVNIPDQPPAQVTINVPEPQGKHKAASSRNRSTRKKPDGPGRK